MIIRDEAKIGRDKLEQVIRDKFDVNQGRVDTARKNEHFLLNAERPKHNAAAQWGRGLRTSEVEAKLRRMNPKLKFEEFGREDMANAVANGWPHDKPWHHKRLVYELNRDGQVEQYQICLYPRDFMPEFSILQVAEKEIPNPEYISTGKVPGADAQLSTKYAESSGVGLLGYRQILATLLIAGAKLGEQIITLPQIEREFGPASTAEWQQKVLGGAHDGRPW